MLSRKEKMDEIGIYSYAEMPDIYLDAMYEFHKKLMLTKKKESIILEFINYLLKNNGKPLITDLINFIEIQRGDLLFNDMPKKLRKNVEAEFGVKIKEYRDDGEDDCGSFYLKNIMKQLPNYEFLCSKKDMKVTVNGVTKKKPVMIYSITKID